MSENKRFEEILLNQLIYNEIFFIRSIPFIKLDYFDLPAEQLLIKKCLEYFNKYEAKIPDIDVLRVLVEKTTSVGEKTYNDAVEFINTNLVNEGEYHLEWLVNETENFCRDKAVYNAILSSIKILEGDDKINTKESIPGKLEDALAISFDTQIGHDFLDDAEDRHDWYTRTVNKYPTHLEKIDEVTYGGFEKKTINVFAGGPGSGKTALMCTIASNYITQGNNVLYITMEMADVKIANRIDANLMNVKINDCKNISKSIFSTKIDKMKSKGYGKLIVKEYPTGTAHTGHFEALLQELTLKKKFAPDVIIIDYLNICSSKTTQKSAGSYTYVKSIIEEIRALMIKYNAVGVTGTQLNRGGTGNTDAGHEAISESTGTTQTGDFVLALLVDDDLGERARILARQVKNRYGSEADTRKFLMGFDRGYSRFYDVDEDFQSDNTTKTESEEDDIPSFDRATNGRTLIEKGNLSKFSQVKF